MADLIFCVFSGSPSAKRLLWNEFPKTPTPFKASNKENGQRNHVYSDAVVSSGIQQLIYWILY